MVLVTRLARHRVQLEALMRLSHWHRGRTTSLVRWFDEVIEEGRVPRILHGELATRSFTKSITGGGVEGDHGSE